MRADRSAGELRALLRRELESRPPKEWRGRALYAAALVAMVVFVALLLAPASPVSWRGEGLRPFALIAGLQTLAVLATAPVRGALAMAGRSQRQRLTEARESGCAPASILLAKLAAETLGLLQLLVASMPVAGVCALWGGGDLQTFLGLYATHALLALSLVALGLAVGTCLRVPWAAALLALVLALAPLLITAAPAAWYSMDPALSPNAEIHFGLHWFLPPLPAWSPVTWPHLFSPGYALHHLFAYRRAASTGWLAAQGAGISGMMPSS